MLPDNIIMSLGGSQFVFIFTVCSSNAAPWRVSRRCCCSTIGSCCSHSPLLPLLHVHAVLSQQKLHMDAAAAQVDAAAPLRDHRPLMCNEDDYRRMCAVPKEKGANFRDMPGVVTHPGAAGTKSGRGERLAVCAM